MAILVTPFSEPAAVWRAALRRQCPGVDVQCWPDVGDRSAIEFALIGALSHGELARLPRLALIASIFAGQDLLLADPELPPHVPIVRTDDRDGDPMIAEYVLLHVLRHHRNLPAYARAQAERRWGRLPQPYAAQRRVGVMGLGPIGLRAARSVRAMGFDVAGWTRRSREIAGIPTFHGAEQLAEFLRRTEILVNLLPLTRETEDLLNGERFGQLPKGAALVNAGRGQHVVDGDLLAALDSGHLEAATLDAFRKEPLPPEHPFWSHPRITITPHAARRLDISGIVHRAVEQWRRLQRGDALQNVVDRAAGY